MALAVHATGTVSRAPRHAQLACFANPAWQAVSRSASDLTGGSCDAKIGRQTLALFGFVTVRFHYGRKETYNHVVKCVCFFFCKRACVVAPAGVQRLLRFKFRYGQSLNGSEQACRLAITTMSSSILIRWWVIMTPD